jgi:endonuclease/exonuclease/phosphatase family metal-dependent hydrolase
MNETAPAPPAQRQIVRLVTYNVHGCVGADGLLSEDRVAEVLASTNADVIALQELDIGRERSNHEHQPETIARLLGMSFLFCSTVRHGDGHYGHALMSKRPLRLVHSGALPGLTWPRTSEPRHAMWAEADLAVDGRTARTSMQIICTHLGLSPRERYSQASMLLSEAWMRDPRYTGVRILCGDLNAGPRSLTYHRLRMRMNDAQMAAPGNQKPRPTFPGRFPVFRIDHVFASHELSVRHTEVVSSPLARRASDHLPLLVDLELPSM